MSHEPVAAKTIRDLEMGILFFASGEDSMVGDKYRFLLECARFADEHGFSSVWVPERHFTRFGCLYPNPAVLHAAVATVTRRVRLCAGSVVMPLHDPIRVAEEWAVVDNLSHGRVGLSIAPGWNPNDFAFFPERYPDRKGEMYRALEVVQKIWRGGELYVTNGAGRRVKVRVYPTPWQTELPVWVTAAGSPESFVAAGERGTNLLTHLLDHDIETLGGKIRLYREARARRGHDPQAGIVTCMLHTFVGADADETREQARVPYCTYLKSNLDLAKGLAHNRGHKIDFEALSEKDLDQFLNFLYDRFVFERALIGTPDTCYELCGQLFRHGVDEIAALLDFGPPEDLALANLPHLDELRRRVAALPPERYARPAEPAAAVAAPSAPPMAGSAPDTSDALAAVRARCTEEWDAARFYDGLAVRGLHPAEPARRVRRVRRRDGEALGEVGATNVGGLDPGSAPDVLEASLHVALAALPREGEAEALYLPAGLRAFQMHAALSGPLAVHAVLRGGAQGDDQAYEADVNVLAHDGTVLAQAHGLRLLRSAPPRSAPSADEGVADWLYRMQWEPRPTPVYAERAPGAWLVLRDRQGVGDELVRLLTAQGHECLALYYDELPELATLPPEDTSGVAFHAVLERFLGTRGRTGHAIVHLWSLDATAPEQTTPASLLRDQHLGVRSAVQLIQALARREGAKRPPLWLVTRGAQALSDEAMPLAVSQAPLWAIGRTCAAEHPDLWGGLADLDPAETPAQAARGLPGALLCGDREDHIAFRSGQRYVGRLAHYHLEPAAPLRVRPDAAYLITGGLDGVGRQVGRWLGEQGARHLILLGRTRIPPRDTWDQPDVPAAVARRIAGIRDLEALGMAVLHPSVDMTDEAAVRTFFDDYRRSDAPPIAGVFHAASALRGPDGKGLVGPISYITPHSFDHVLPAKMVGAWLLQELVPAEALDFLMFFSAGAALLGSAGQGNYAAANGFLDALAHDLSRRKKARVLAINWGPVTDVGFGVTPEGRAMHGIWERRGILGITPAQVLEALGLLLAQERVAQVGVMRTDWTLLQRAYAEALSAPWASLLVGAVGAPAQADLLTLLEQADPADRHGILALHIQEQVVVVMGFTAADAPEFDQGLFEIGLDSLLALELKNHVQKAIRRDFSATALFDHPSISALASYLLADVLQLPAGGQVAQAAPVRTDVLADIEALSEADVERLLAERVAGGAA